MTETSQVIASGDLQSLQTIIDRIPVATLIIGKDGLFIDCNKKTLEIFGATSRQDIVGRPPNLLSPKIQRNGKDSGTEAGIFIQKAHSEGSISFYWEHMTLQGSVFQAKVTLNEILYEGKPCLMTTVTDMTGQVRMEENETLIQKNPYALLDLNPDFTIANVNEAFLAMSGYERDEWIGKPLKDLHVIHREGPTVERAIETKSTVSGRITIEFPTGTKKLEYSYVPVFDADGHTIRIYDIFADMTPELDQIAYYQSILDAVPYPIHVTDLEMNWKYMNKSFEQLLIDNNEITDRDSAYGKPCSTANANICGTNECGIHQLTTTGKHETFFDWHGASCKQTTAPVLNAEGKTVGYVETVQDLTEQMNQIAYYQSILDAVPYPIHVTDNDMKWTYMNRSFETLLIENKEITDRDTAYGKPCSTANANICGTSECGIHQLTTSGKNETFFDWHGASCKQTTAPVLNAKGTRVGFVETVQDLTEQMNQIAYYQSILDAVPYPIHVTDNDMKWKYMNKSFESLLIENKEIKDRDSAYGKPCSTANANICGTSECGIHQLTTTGKNETFFDWHGASCKQTTAPVLDVKGNRVGFVETVQDLTEQISVIAYLKTEVGRLTENLKYLSEGNLNLNMEITKADTYTQEAYGLFVNINDNIGVVTKTLANLVTDVNSLATAAVEGKLSTRADVSRHKGQFRSIIEGVNNTLDSVITPLNVAANYVDRISKGDIPPKITDSYNGDFNIIKNNLNTCIDAVNLLVTDTNLLVKAAVEGKLETRADASKHQGDFKKIVVGVNDTLDSVIVPVKEALRVSKQYANYQFNTRVDPSLKVAGDWVEFKNVLDNIGVQVSGAVKLINNQLADLSANAEEATASIEEVSAGAQQIATNAGGVSVNAERGNDGLNQVLRAMEDLTITVSEVSQRAEQVSTTSTKANEYSRIGIDLAKQSESSMVEITKSTSEVDLIVKDINQQMDEIGKIVRLISDIANQTNLLALNAAIEAARAGEAGRGFAVVAAEVKSLAQDSRQSAENIADMISTLQNKARNATIAMGKAGETVEEGSKSLHETLNAFNKIASSIDDITRNATDVASASEEQAASVQEVTASISEVSTLVQNTSKEAGDAAAATEEASASIEQISRVVNNVSSIVESVAQEINKFVI